MKGMRTEGSYPSMHPSQNCTCVRGEGRGEGRGEIPFQVMQSRHLFHLLSVSSCQVQVPFQPQHEHRDAMEEWIPVIQCFL